MREVTVGAPRPEGTFEKSSESQVPWQLRMLSKSLKKQQKLRLLLRQIGETRGKECLLVTNGDNNGALNYRFRSHGGSWTWVENEPDNIPEMMDLLGEPVLKGKPSTIPLGDEEADVVVSIDVHEHLSDCGAFNRELRRVTKRGGVVVVTTPNGDPWKPVTILKKLVGMTKEVYGHVVYGYDLKQLSAMMSEVGLTPVGSGSYSRFFTEMLELVINFAYVKLFSRKGKGTAAKAGAIAPTTKKQLRSVERQYKIYSVLYPFLWVLSKLDLLVPFFTGYAVSVVCRRPV